MNESKTWARDFYQGLFVELWLRAIPEQQTRQEVDFLEKSAPSASRRQRSGSRVRRWATLPRACGTRLCRNGRRYDPVHGRLHINYTFIRETHVEKKSAFAQLYTYKEFCRLFADAGFHSIQGYGSTGQEPFRLESPELFLMAMKPGE